MPIFIYNSLTRKKELFEPVEKGRVGMYVCGPTVYDEPHIGHARSAYVFDVIRRYLKYRGYEVKFVRNVTDVDDKIIEKAKQEYKNEDLNTAVKKVSDKYLKSYHEAMNKLGIQAPDLEPRASEYIEKMKVFIKILIDRGMAYESGGDVYFDIKKAKDYGALSHQLLQNMEAGTRIAPGENKKDPLDFALWKKAKEDEPSWPSDWGNGRPGWHIECSVMSSDILGDEFDIHGGGLDLIFPHHENEKAQSEGAGKKFARYWIHHGLLTINGQKMSKSLGNFITIQDALKKYSSDDLKLFFLSSHYASPVDFTKKKIDDAEKMRERIEECLNRIFPITINYPKAELKNRDFILRIKEDFDSSMDDDFNTPRALSCILDLIKEINKFIDKHTRDSDYIGVIENAEFYIRQWSQVVFGLSYIGNREILEDEGVRRFVSKNSTDDWSDEEFDLVNRRENARKAKNYAESDRLRIEIEKRGIIVKDTKEGPIYQRKT